MANYVTRARDVRFKLAELGMEKGTIFILERICEDQEMLRQEMAAVVQTTNKMADIVSNIAAVGHKLKNDWERVRQKMNDPRFTNGEDDE